VVHTDPDGFAPEPDDTPPATSAPTGAAEGYPYADSVQNDSVLNLEPSPPQFRLPTDLDTPALVVDLARLEANLRRMADSAAAAGVALRPHAKTHKCVPLGRRQIALGATGLTVATLAEAELFAAGGVSDLFIAYPLWAGPERAARVRALHEQVRLQVGVESPEAAEMLAAAVRGSATPLRVLIEVECGLRRTGVAPAAVPELALTCMRLGLEVVGAFTHPGHAYRDPGSVEDAAADERTALSVAGAALAALTGEPPVLSGGSTPTALAGLGQPLTEVRPGTYVFGDRQQMHLAGMAPEQVALVVAARVVSAPRPGEVVLDAGSKTLSADRPQWLEGHGWLPDHPEARVVTLNEEHAVVTGLTNPPRVGELVAVVPNHVCPAVNLGRRLLVVSDGAIVDEWPVHTPA
jgi:D-serine deaminase-like pyridoxal phosphate-dependent protein